MATARESFMRGARALADEVLRCAGEAYDQIEHETPPGQEPEAVFITAIIWHDMEPMTVKLFYTLRAKEGDPAHD